MAKWDLEDAGVPSTDTGIVSKGCPPTLDIWAYGPDSAMSYQEGLTWRNTVVLWDAKDFMREMVCSVKRTRYNSLNGNSNPMHTMLFRLTVS